MRRRSAFALALLAGPLSAPAAEVTVKNDSLTDFSTAVIVTGFIGGGGAGSWLTSPCDGALRAVQVFWRSSTGTTGTVIHQAIQIRRAGTFPTPGALAETIGGPVLNDGVLNEWRFIDQNNVIPLNVPVASGETFVVAIVFDNAPPAGVGPSVVRDTDGIQPNRNAIYTNFGTGFAWFSAGTLGVTGDWVIRGVIDCPVSTPEADVAVGLASTPAFYEAGQPLTYTVVVSNAGPSAAPGTTVVDILPAAYTGASWTCAGSAGGTCPVAGTGNVTVPVDLPAGAQVVFAIDGTVAPGTTGVLVNSATAVVAAGIADPLAQNNVATVQTAPASDLIFAHGFE
jgi:uncharacterized repeat protein (TIGR01451 family)